MTATNAPSAIVADGGLAGMTVARELAARGWRVTLLERTQRSGAAGVAAGGISFRPNPLDPGGGRGAGHRLV